MTPVGIAVHADALQFAKRIGYDYAELPGREICAMDEAEFAALAARLPLPVYGFNAYCPPEIVIAGPGYKAEQAVSYAKKCAERAAALGVKMVGVGSPRSRDLPADFPLSLAYTQIEEFLFLTAREFAPYGITVCLEPLAPCFCNFINTVADAERIVRGLDIANLRLVADYYNMEHVAEADDSLRGCMDLIVHAHISDDDGSPTKRAYLKQEKRQIHIARVQRGIQDGYTGAITLEIDVEPDAERAAASLAALREAVGT